jgi:hypothetical protein
MGRQNPVKLNCRLTAVESRRFAPPSFGAWSLYFVNLKLARWKVPSFSWMTSWRQVFPPSLAVCLPDVGVGVGERVVGEAAAAGGDGFFDSVDGVGGVARSTRTWGSPVAKIVVPWFPPRL